MSRNERLGLALGALVLIVVAFLVLKPGDDSEPAPSPTASPTVATAPAGEPPAASTEQAPPPPRVPQIAVRDLAPVGGVRGIEVRKGETIRFVVRSDQPEEVHVHGYDVARDVGPGAPARFAIPATIAGIFEVELEHAGVQIAEVTVEP